MRATEYPFTKQFEVVFRDIDAMQHVNNAVYVTYLETVRIAYMNHVLHFEGLQQVPVILGDLYVRYLSPATYGEVLTCGIGVSRFGTKSFEFVYQIDGPDNRPIVSARTTQVAYDYTINRSIVVPDWLRAAFEGYQSVWQPERS